MFCCKLLYVQSSIEIILMGKRELVSLLNLSSWCLVMVERLFLAVPWGCLQFVIVVFPNHTYLLLLSLKPPSHRACNHGVISRRLILIATSATISTVFFLFLVCSPTSPGPVSIQLPTNRRRFGDCLSFNR